MVNDDLVSAVASRLARLERKVEPEVDDEIAVASGGKNLAALAGDLLGSLDREANKQKATERFDCAEGQEPTEEQIDQVEQEAMAAALKPFHNPKLRDRIVTAVQTLEQVIDEITRDELVRAEFDGAAREKAASKIEDWKKWVEENRDEVEAIQILYSQPYRAGLRFRHIKELAAAIEKPPLMIREPQKRLWEMYRAVEPEKVKGKGKSLVDLISLVRHAIEPDNELIPVSDKIEERYDDWLLEQEDLGVEFTSEQRAWLDAIKDHIANSLAIDQDDFQYAPFNQMGGIGKAIQVFGDQLPTVLNDLNERLAA
jgi:type I restriction enzyme R subunit